MARDPASLEATWSELARRRARPTIFLTPEWIAVARAHDPREQVTLSIDDRGVAALAYDGDGTLTFAGGELTDEQDVVAATPDVERVAGSLGRWIAAEHIARAAFSYVPEESGTTAALAAPLRTAGYRVDIARLVASPRLDLPADFESYVHALNKTERHELRRKIRRLETGRRARFRIASGEEQGRVLDRFVELHRRSRGEKARFMTGELEAYFRDLADALAARGWLRLGVLEVAGEDAAVLYAFAYEGTMALYNAAYDPALASLSVGIVSHAYAIRAAITEGMRTYDFLRGGEPYKYDLGAQEHWLLRLVAARP